MAVLAAYVGVRIRQAGFTETFRDCPTHARFCKHRTRVSLSGHVRAGTMLCGELLDRDASFRFLSTAAERGLRQWDTAEMYPVPQRAATQGMSEALLGQWLQGQDKSLHKVTTKVAGPGGMDWLRGGPERLDTSNIQAALDASLQRLRLDCIDTLLLHWPDRCAIVALRSC